MKFINLCLASLTVLLMSACAKEEPITVAQVMKDTGNVAKENAFSYSLVEKSMDQAVSNARVVAMEYIRSSERLAGWPGLIVKIGPVQSSTCIQGSGWAEVVVQRVQKDNAGKSILDDTTKKEVVDKAVLYCSTTSINRGCVMASVTGANVNNWATHPGKAQYGKCASTVDVPYPLPVVSSGKQ
jgi:hypothetical protein